MEIQHDLNSFQYFVKDQKNSRIRSLKNTSFKNETKLYAFYCISK